MSVTAATVNEVILGFDVRDAGPNARAEWSESRRATYLLRDAPLPLSVDELVWPTAFAELPERTAQFNATAAASGGYRAFTPPGWIPRPLWIGPNDLWDNLSAMRARVREASMTPEQRRDLWEIAITWHSSDLKKRRTTSGLLTSL